MGRRRRLRNLDNNVPNQRSQWNSDEPQVIKIQRCHFKKAVRILTGRSRPSAVRSPSDPNIMTTNVPTSTVGALNNQLPCQPSPSLLPNMTSTVGSLNTQPPSRLLSVVRIDTPPYPFPAVPNMTTAVRTSTIGSLNIRPPSQPSPLSLPNMTNDVSTSTLGSLNNRRLSRLLSVVRINTPSYRFPAVPNLTNVVRTPTTGSLNTTPPSWQPCGVRINTPPLLPNMTDVVRISTVESRNAQPPSDSPSAIRISNLPYRFGLNTPPALSQPPSAIPINNPSWRSCAVRINTPPSLPNMSDAVRTSTIESLNAQPPSDSPSAILINNLPYRFGLNQEEWSVSRRLVLHGDEYQQQENIPPPQFPAISSSGSVDQPNALNNQGSNNIQPPPIPGSALFRSRDRDNSQNNQRPEGIPPPPIPANSPFRRIFEQIHHWYEQSHR